MCLLVDHFSRMCRVTFVCSVIAAVRHVAILCALRANSEAVFRRAGAGLNGCFGTRKVAYWGARYELVSVSDLSQITCGSTTTRCSSRRFAISVSDDLSALGGVVETELVVKR